MLGIRGGAKKKKKTRHVDCGDCMGNGVYFSALTKSSCQTPEIVPESSDSHSFQSSLITWRNNIRHPMIKIPDSCSILLLNRNMSVLFLSGKTLG